MRKQSRDILFKLLFAKNFGENDMQKQTFEERLPIMLEEMHLKPVDIDEQYIHNSFDDIVQNLDEYKQIVASRVTGYKQDRIFNVDMTIMILAIYELKKGDLDSKIVISEALKLAKKYSTEKSIKFINGILGAVSKQDNE